MGVGINGRKVDRVGTGASDRPLVVLPTYREAENIVPILESVRAALPLADVLVVDDAGDDGTADVAEEAAARLGGIEVLRRPAKSGLGSAYRSGFALALERGYDPVVEMDADGSHDPSALPALLAGLDHADLVIGSRYVPGGVIPRWSIHRRLLSRGGNQLAALSVRTRVRDLTSGFRVFRAEALRTSGLPTVRSEGYGFQIEMAARVLEHGGRVVEVPISFCDRTRGESKLSWRIVAEALVLCAVLSWRHRRRPPSQLLHTEVEPRVVPSRNGTSGVLSAAGRRVGPREDAEQAVGPGEDAA